MIVSVFVLVKVLVLEGNVEDVVKIIFYYCNDVEKCNIYF